MKMNQKIIFRTVALSLVFTASTLLFQSCKAKEEEATEDAAAVVEEAPVVATDTPSVAVDTPETGEKPLTTPIEKKP